MIHKHNLLKQISRLNFKDGTKLIDIISDIIIKDDNIGFTIDVANKNLNEVYEIRDQAISNLKAIIPASKITIVLTSNKNINKESSNSKLKYFIEGAKKVILVASGKGGVGKSTIASLIAEQLSTDGYKIGIVDADIYGPSIPQIFGINTQPEIKDNKMIPIISRNIEIISIGFLAPQDSAFIWRGPMASKAIYKLLSLTDWGNLDYLIIDMPPGTGDIHLSILENYQIDGVILVTTPQKIAEIDVTRSINLYKKFNLPILGIIENMSYFIDPTSAKKLQIFSGDSGENFAKFYNIPLIYKIPIDPRLSYHCDNSLPLTGIVNLPIKNFI